MSTYFYFVVSTVSGMKPGEKFVADAMRLSEGWGGAFGTFISGGWTPPDRVLERVIGSSVTYRYRRYQTSDWLYERLHSALPAGVRSYVSPDRRDWFMQRADGLYQHHETKLTAEDERHILCALRGHDLQRAMLMPPPGPTPLVLDLSAMNETVQLIEGKRCVNCGLTTS